MTERKAKYDSAGAPSRDAPRAPASSASRASVPGAGSLVAGGLLGALAAACVGTRGSGPSRCEGKDGWACFVAGLEAVDEGRIDEGQATLESACHEGEERACRSAATLRAARGASRDAVAGFAGTRPVSRDGVLPALDVAGKPSGPAGGAASALSSSETPASEFPATAPLPGERPSQSPASAPYPSKALFPTLFAGLEDKRATCAWGTRAEGVVVCLVASGTELTTHLRALDRSLRKSSRLSLAIPAGPGLRMGGFTLFLPAASPGSAKLAMAGAPLPSGTAVADALVWRGVERPREPLALVWVTPRGILSGSYVHELAHVAYGRVPVLRRCVETFWRDELAPTERTRVGLVIEGAYGSLSDEALREEMHAYLLQDKPEVQPIAGRLQEELRERYLAFLERPECREGHDRFEDLSRRMAVSGPMMRVR